MTQKTPVSILSEYALKCKQVPEYKSIKPTPEPLAHPKVNVQCFAFSLELFGIKAIGKGSSKKIAKHETACNLWKVLCQQRPGAREFLKVNGVDAEGDLKTPYEKHLSDNAVGDLEKICLFNKLALPKYDFLYEEGQAHNKTFTYKCTIGSTYITEASHRTKKQAKHGSALLMYEKLKSTRQNIDFNLPEDFKINYSDESIEVESERMRSLVIDNSNDLEAAFKKNGVKICNFHTLGLEKCLNIVPTVQSILQEYDLDGDAFIAHMKNVNLDIIKKLIDRITEATKIRVSYKYTINIIRPSLLEGENFYLTFYKDESEESSSNSSSYATPSSSISTPLSQAEDTDDILISASKKLEELLLEDNDVEHHTVYLNFHLVPPITATASGTDKEAAEKSACIQFLEYLFDLCETGDSMNNDSGSFSDENESS